MKLCSSFLGSIYSTTFGITSIYSTSVQLGLIGGNINSEKRYKENTKLKMSVFGIYIKLLRFVMSHMDRHDLLFYTYNIVLESIRLKVSNLIDIRISCIYGTRVWHICLHVLYT
jgi:hypothetical protein